MPLENPSNKGGQEGGGRKVRSESGREGGDKYVKTFRRVYPSSSLCPNTVPELHLKGRPRAYNLSPGKIAEKMRGVMRPSRKKISSFYLTSQYVLASEWSFSGRDKDACEENMDAVGWLALRWWQLTDDITQPGCRFPDLNASPKFLQVNSSLKKNHNTVCIFPNHKSLKYSSDYF